MAVIAADGLTKRFGAVTALSEMHLSVDRGELFGFLGPNGAGKTTTLRILTGQLEPDSGSARILGTDPTADPIGVRRQVGILPEGGSPPSFLSPREYLAFVGRVRDLDPSFVAERIDLWADRLGFQQKLETLHTDLSRGQQQKVMIAQAFLHEPEVVLIDEPLANLDPIVQEQVKRFLVTYAADGNTIFISTHNIEVAESICNRVGIVADGSLVTERSPTADGEPLLETFLAYVEDADARDMPSTEPTQR